MPTDTAPSVLDASQAFFLAGPVAINVASRSPALVPSVARAFGCRVDGDRLGVRVFLARSRATTLLRDLAAGGPIAVIFSRPKTHVSLQLKGSRAELLAVTSADRRLMSAYRSAFVAEIVALGYEESFASTMMMLGDEEPVVAARFVVSAAFEQTPGPRAGEPLRART